MTVEFWFSLFELPEQVKTSEGNLIIPEIVFKFYRKSEPETTKKEFALRFKKAAMPPNPPAYEGRFFYNMHIAITPNTVPKPANPILYNFWNGDSTFPKGKEDLVDQVLLSRQWYYFRVSLVKNFELKSYHLQVIIVSPSNPNKITLFLDKDISAFITEMTVD